MKLDLTKKQIGALMKGRGVQLKPSQIGTGHPVHAGFPMKHRKALMKAMKNQKGVRLKFEPYELEGAGIMDWLRSLGNMIKTPLKALAPVLKPVAKAIAPVVAPIIASKTGIPITGDILEKGVDVVGNLAGVGFKPAGYGARGRGTQLSSDSSTMMTPVHPVMRFQPQFTGHDVRRTIQGQKGAGIVFNPSQFQNSWVPQNRTGGAGFRAAGY